MLEVEVSGPSNGSEAQGLSAPVVGCITLVWGIPAVKVLAADGYILCSGLLRTLTLLYDNVCVTTANSIDDVFAHIPESSAFDLVLLDADMPGMENFAGLRRVVKRLPDVPVIITSPSENCHQIVAAILSGARGYVLPSSKPGVLKHALQLIMAGEFYIPARVLHPSSGYSLQFERPLPPAVMSVGGDDFTARQREVTLMLADGKSNKQIARELKVLECTVKLHVRSILRKLGVKNRTEAVLAAARAGYLPSETHLRPDLGHERLPSTAGNGSG